MTTPRESPDTPWSGANGGDPLEDRRCRATSKRSGERCRRWASPGQRVCPSHGAASPQARAAAARRRAEAEATALLQLVWDPDAAPVTDPVTALQALAGRLQHAADVLGAKIDAVELDGPTGLAWARVIRELRQSLEGMQRLDLAARHIELEQARADIVVAAVRQALDALGPELLPAQRGLFIRVFLKALGQPVPDDDPGSSPVVAGELG